ncbi:MAG: uroporphyrinogen-III synthase [Nitrososphaerota archaeon]
MARKITVILPTTLETSRNIARYLRGLDIEVRVMPVVKVEVDWGEVERARKLFSLNIEVDLTIFTSKTAVRIVREHLPEAWKHVEKHALAIGPGTASLLESLGVKRVEIPTEHSSKGLISVLSRTINIGRLILYCSKDVNMLLEEFIKEKFRESIIFKLYSIGELSENVKKIAGLVGSDNSKIFIIIISSMRVLRSLLSKRELLDAKNVIYSVFSKRLLEEAERRGVCIHHYPETHDLKNYYLDLRRYINRLLRDSYNYS